MARWVNSPEAGGVDSDVRTLLVLVGIDGTVGANLVLDDLGGNNILLFVVDELFVVSHLGKERKGLMGRERNGRIRKASTRMRRKGCVLV